MKDKEAKRFAIEKAQIEALIEKHRPRTPKTPDEVSRLGTGKNAKVDGQEGTKKEKPPYNVRCNLAMHCSVAPFIMRQPIRRPRLLERVYKPMRTSH